jgi:hypothetical protein
MMGLLSSEFRAFPCKGDRQWAFPAVFVLFANLCALLCASVPAASMYIACDLRRLGACAELALDVAMACH